MITKMKMTMMIKKAAVQKMSKKRRLVLLTRHSGLKYKLLSVRLWLIWKKRFVS